MADTNSTKQNSKKKWSDLLQSLNTPFYSHFAKALYINKIILLNATLFAI